MVCDTRWSLHRSGGSFVCRCGEPRFHSVTVSPPALLRENCFESVIGRTKIPNRFYRWIMLVSRRLVWWDNFSFVQVGIVLDGHQIFQETFHHFTIGLFVHVDQGRQEVHSNTHPNEEAIVVSRSHRRRQNARCLDQMKSTTMVFADAYLASRSAYENCA